MTDAGCPFVAIRVCFCFLLLNFWRFHDLGPRFWESCASRFAILCRQGAQIGHTPSTAGTFRKKPFWINQGPLNGGVSNGGVSRSGLVLPFLSFSVLFVLLGLFPIFPGFSRDLSRDSPGIFPIGPFPLSQPINSTYEEQSRKGPRHNLDLSRKKWETTRFGKPPV